MDQEMIDWLTKRGTEEARNVQVKNMASIKAIGSREEFDTLHKEINKSLGKMEMIDEILKHYIATHPLPQSGINNDGNDRR